MGIASRDELDRAEADISAAVLTRLPDDPNPGDFDLSHLQALHRALFGSLYDWAGELRRVELSKGNTRFAYAPYLADSAKKLFQELHQESLLRGLGEDQFVERLAHYYSEINVLHPFREGNGRTQRAIFTLLANQSGHRIRWEDLDPEENLKASVAAYTGDLSGLIAMFHPLVVVDEQ